MPTLSISRIVEVYGSSRRGDPFLPAYVKFSMCAIEMHLTNLAHSLNDTERIERRVHLMVMLQNSEWCAPRVDG
jgi:hypothetical protein